MTVTACTSATGAASRKSRHHAAWLAGVSALAMLLSHPNAAARPLGAPPAQSVPAASGTAQAAAQETMRAASGSLRRATLAIQAQQASQQAARDAARAAAGASPVPNGLGAGGLEVAPQTGAGNLWQGANLPTQFADGDRVRVNIAQTQQKAILTWNTFNVGARTDLNFDQQRNRNWVVLNRVLGTDGRPSQILGSIKADGSVYVINQNGIIFGGASQVNVGALIASTAKIDPQKFLDSGIFSSQSANVWTPSFTDAAEFLGVREGAGRIEVKAGAQVVTHAPASVTQGGGFVLLLGGEVVNAGAISTPRGQSLLAAGDDFVLRPGYGTDANIASTTRGIEVAPLFDAGSRAGLVRNHGMISSAQGDITLAGRTIAQSGILLASTSVNTRGTIHLLNAATDALGSVTLGAGSVTIIVPELDGVDTALNSQRDALIAASVIANQQRAQSAGGVFNNLSLLADRQDQSRIEIVTGGNVVFEGGATPDTGSLTIAQGGQVAVTAGRRIFTGSGATVDVSGVRDVVLAMSANNLMVNIQGNELRDAPANRDGEYLRNGNVWVDIRDLIYLPSGTGGYQGDRYYTPGGLLEVGGYLANTRHGIGEWSAVGGTITLSAPEVIAQQGSRFDISGGSVRYEAGYVKTSNFLGRDGALHNINDARGDMLFYGVGQGFIREHQRWNVTEVWSSPIGRGRVTRRWEDGYTVGRDAGRLNLSTPTAIFEGDIVADVVQGSRQTTARPDGIVDGYKAGQNVVAQAGTLALGLYDAFGRNGVHDTDVRIGDIAAVTAGLGAGAVLPAGRANTVWFDAGDLNRKNLGGIDLATGGRIAVERDLVLADGGALTLIAPFVEIDAAVTIRGGDILAGNALVARVPTVLTRAGLASVRLGADARLDVSGLWANALLDPADDRLRAYIAGGSVRLQSTGDVTVASGSLIDASGGAFVSRTGSLKGGKGGDVVLVAGYSMPNVSYISGALTFDGGVRAYGFDGGGTLTLQAGERDVSIAGAAAGSGPLALSAELFSTGFSSYVVTTNRSMRVEGDVGAVVPVYRMMPDGLAAPTGSAMSGLVELWLPPGYLENPASGKLTQRAGADLALMAVRNFALTAGHTIEVDPGRAVEIHSHGQTTIDGTIRARGGQIVIGSDLGAITQSLQTGVAGQSIWIGGQARLDASAEAVIRVDNAGLRYGVVSNGGSISIGLKSMTPDATDTLSATRSMVVVRPGAVLDVSGSHGMLDLAVDRLASPAPMAIASDGGSIMIGSMTGLAVDGELRAFAGGTGAAGGSLTLVLENSILASPPGQSPHIFTITQQHVRILPTNLAAGQADPAIPYGTARISAEQIAAGGFDDLLLWNRDVFRFEGGVHLSLGRSLALYRGVLSAPTADTHVVLSAPHVLIDGAVNIYQPEGTFYPGLNLGAFSPAMTNHGSLRVEADLIDMRNAIWSGGRMTYQPSPATPAATIQAAGFGVIDLVSRGDIRFGTGFLAGGGNTIKLEAAQIYPLTGATATIGAGFGGTYLNPDGIIIVRGNGSTPALPQSAFGNLGLVAATIDQGGILRAPLGKLALGDQVVRRDGFPVAPFNVDLAPVTVILRGGSITSTSAAGLLMPYGGTADGQSYRYAGTEVTFDNVANLASAQGVLAPGVTIKAERVVAEPGSRLDLSGGGQLTGAGFISGRGGSVDVLQTPLVNANPANTYSTSSNKVYAIVPGYAGGYAPLSPDRGAGDPRIGQQITLTEPAGGLAPGTYTLLPSTYALLPGAWRVEIGGSATSLGHAIAVGNGSYVSTGTLGFAHTDIRASLPSRLVLTPGATVRSFSQYNETSYSDFARANAALFGVLRPRLPADAQALTFDFKMATGDVLSFKGETNLAPAEDGFGGVVMVRMTTNNRGNPPNGTFEIRSSETPATAGMTSLAAEDLSRFSAGSLLIGGSYFLSDTTNSNALDGPRISFFNNAEETNIVVRGGAALRAGQIFLIAANEITIENGAVLDTTQNSARVFDSTIGYMFGGLKALLAVGNGKLDFLAPGVAATGTITIEDGAALRTLGTISFTASQGLRLGTDVALNARYLSLGLPEINVGTEASLDAARAAGALGSGWTLTQSVLDRLLAPGDSTLPGVERLTLAATSSLNFFGDVTLDMRGGNGANGRTLALSTPGIFGWGSSGDVASLRTDVLIWNGSLANNTVLANPYGLLTPPAERPGTGSGTFRIDAREIVFGYGSGEQYQNETSLDRLALGFARVDLVASERITANNRGALSVYQSYDLGTKTYAGGDLNLISPLVTAQGGGVMSYTAGGAVVAQASGSGAAGTAGTRELGGELRFNGYTVSIDTAVALPSGRLAIKADGDIVLTDRARIDLSGRSVAFFDVTKHSWGGDVDLRSTGGRVVLAAGSVIDVSAGHSEAGSIVVEAAGLNGDVVLNGTLRGDGADGYADGSFAIRTRSLADFAALNRQLDAGAFFESRSIAVQTGNLVVGNEVRAHHVTLSADGGSLTVVGTIDASGSSPGTIRLSARDDLTLAPGAVLDAHGTVLQVDGAGQPIEAKNRGQVELTSSEGWVRLEAGATIDLSAPDHVARGRLEINARRLGGTDGAGAGANDIAVDAAGPLVIRGAASVAVNGFRRYELPDGSTVDQGLFDGIHGDSSAFIDAALANSALQGRLAGLRAYGDAFHLRPGVEIRSDGDIATRGDIDFSGYRYGPQANSAQRGSGEAGVVWIRAGGNFNVNGSITDGFGRPLASPDDSGWILPTGIALPGDITVPADIVLPGTPNGQPSGVTTFTTTPGFVLAFDIPLNTLELKANAVIPVEVRLAGPISLPAGFVLKGDIIQPNGTVLSAGTRLLTNTPIATNSRIMPGSILPDRTSIMPMTWPAGTPLDVFVSQQISLAAPVTVRAGTVVPAGMTIPRITQTLTADTVMSQPIVLAGGTGGSTFPVRAGLSLPFSINVAGITTIRRGVAIPFGFTIGASTNLALPAGWVPSSRILNADGTIAFEAGQPVPTGARLVTGMQVGAGIVLPTGGILRVNLAIPKNTVLATYFTGTAIGVSTPVFIDAGMSLPAGTVVQKLIGAELRPRGSDGTMGHTYAIAPMLDQGMQSWSMRYVAGADLGAADARGVGLAGAGDLVLNDPHFHYGSSAQVQQALSVLRTGTGYLELLAGGDYRQKSLFGVYTAGTQTGSVTRDAAASDDPFVAALHDDRFYFTEGGGDVLLSARGNLQGYAAPIGGPQGTSLTSSSSANWQLSDGDDRGVNFGTYDNTGGLNVLRGFASIGSLGGGNVVLMSGANVLGVTAGIGSSRQTNVGGTSVFRGGGDLSVDVAGGMSNAVLANLRGDLDLRAGFAGNAVAYQFGKRHENDPRAPDLTTSYGSTFANGNTLSIGDGALTAYARSEIVATVSADLGWTDSTRAVVFAAGGDLGLNSFTAPSLSAIATGGDILLSGTSAMVPSPHGQLELLAWDTINGRGNLNASSSGQQYWTLGAGDPSINLHIDDPEPARLYAVNGDILSLRLGNRTFTSPTTPFDYTNIFGKQVWLMAGRDIVGLDAAILNSRTTDVSRISAGRDIIFYGAPLKVEIAGPGVLEVTAGRNIYMGDDGSLASLGPFVRGDLRPGAGIAVQAGAGAGVPGIGNVNWTAFADRYLRSANLADVQLPLADQPGKVARTYEKELLQWLADRYGFNGGEAAALAYFMALSPEQQRVFLRQVYFAELLASGREYNDPASSRFNSYLRGRNAIASLFPETDAAGNRPQRGGDLIMFQGVENNGGIRTIAGGSIKALVPDGQITVGISGMVPASGPGFGTPPVPAGLLTQGEGDIRLYSHGSIQLGLSRIMTTFGGDIQAWSATGDINAGRGAKTTVIYTPPKRVYDAYGNVALSPMVPSSGAGIATLNPIPGIAAGDVDLVAPLGTIDAGEAGIRSSGNVNLAALQILNAANIQAQGNTTGVPVVQAPSVSGLTEASNVAGAAAQQTVTPTQNTPAGQPSVIIVEVLGYGGGPGAEESPAEDARDRKQRDRPEP